MKFIIFVIDHPMNLGNPDEMREIDSFNDHLQSNGYWVMAAGIGDPTTATLIDNRNDKSEVAMRTLFEGHPNHNANYSGFWIIDVPSKEVAVTIAAQGSKACNRQVELRPFLGNA
jgi:hypothetical protein